MRAYGKHTEIIIDRESKMPPPTDRSRKSVHVLCPLRLSFFSCELGETRSHALLARYGLAPALLARFQNGLLYRFIRGSPATPAELITPPVWRGVARRLGQWHAVLPLNIAVKTVADVDEVPSKNQQVDLEPDQKSNHKQQVNGFHPVKPRQPGPNLWTILQKWILALPATTDDERSRRRKLQGELEWIIGELDDGQGIGENSVCDYVLPYLFIYLFPSFLPCRLTTGCIVGLRPL